MNKNGLLPKVLIIAVLFFAGLWLGRIFMPSQIVPSIENTRSYDLPPLPLPEETKPSDLIISPVTPGPFYLEEQRDEYARTHYANVDCSTLTGWVFQDDVMVSRQSACAGERAWFENNIEFCKLHDDPDGCLGWMAIKTGDLKICEMKEKKTGYFWIQDKLSEKEQQNAWLYECYWPIANWRNDPAICDLIPYATEDLRQRCKDTAKNWTINYLRYKDHSPI